MEVANVLQINSLMDLTLTKNKISFQRKTNIRILYWNLRNEMEWKFYFWSKRL